MDDPAILRVCTVEETNALFRDQIAKGKKGLSVAFDLPTQRGYDSDHGQAEADVGKTGVAIDSIEDIHALFEGIALGDVSVSMTISGAVLPVLAFYIAAAKERGFNLADLAGTIQNDILKEFIVRNTYIYPPEPSLRIVTDIVRFTSAHMPRFHPISISGYHMQEAGATPVQELAFTIANGMEYVRALVARGLAVDDLAKLGQDGHDRGASVVAAAFKLMGFRVEAGALFQSPEETVRQALDHRVHVIGISSLAGALMTLVPRVLEQLKERGAREISVVCGGIIPRQDWDALCAEGVAAIFGPGTPAPECAARFLDIIRRSHLEHCPWPSNA